MKTIGVLAGLRPQATVDCELRLHLGQITDFVVITLNGVHMLQTAL